MKALITGGAGFIGSHLAEKLSQDPSVTQIRVLDNLSTGHLENLQAVRGKIEWIQGDLLDEGARRRAVEGMEVIFHLAAIPSVPRSVESPLESHLNGAHATLLLLESARTQGVRRVIYSASSSAYGDSETLPKVETQAPRPESPYAASKLAGEEYVAAFARCYALDAVSLRYFNIFGPRQDPASMYSGVIARFCRAFCRGEEFTIHGDGEQSRDFTYVENAVQANLLAAQASARLGGQVLNVGGGERCSLNQLVALLNELTAQKREPVRAPARVGDVRHSLADLSRIRSVLGYQPAVTFREGLARTLEWYKK